ncbi:MAG: heme d1 biosynthesis radical SAM protein NirJ [Magnetospirillum sp.]|nr:heme d1 biosynthesis radical SAM protein NirJ [Magnetospirillum sp.]
MFRLSQFMRELTAPTPAGPRRLPPGPVVIWNLVRRCNLTCRHCYSISADKDFAGELSTDEVSSVLDDLKAFRVPALILSGGEPLLRSDIFAIAARAKGLGFYTALSTNGTLIDERAADRIAAIGIDYLGISIDGIGEVHDHFRGKEGAFAHALAGLRHCRDRGVKVGLRFTMTRDNEATLPAVLDLAEGEGIAKFYLSHLNYAGRGNKNRGEDSAFAATRAAMDALFERVWAKTGRGEESEFVTGNNDADGAFFHGWVARRFPAHAEHIRAKLEQWGGNASGVAVANIDNLGNVHPDTMWGHVTLGNVRARRFGDIWSDVSHPLMAGLKAFPRRLGGRCGDCRWLGMCNGNSRVRAERIHGEVWAEDPGCYLTDEEVRG